MIKLYQQSIIDLSSPAITTYINLLDKNLINKPIIFSDICNLFFDKNISIFHTYYIRHPSLYNSYFLTDTNGFNYLSSIFRNKFEFNLIVLHTVLEKLSSSIEFVDTKHIKFFNLQDNNESIENYIGRIINV